VEHHNAGSTSRFIRTKRTMPAGRRIFLMPPRSVHVRAEVPISTPRGAKARSQRSRRVAETRFDRTAWGAASSNHTISTTQSYPNRKSQRRL
jgi:hypothetical protein